MGKHEGLLNKLPWRQLGQDQVAESLPSVELPGVKVGRR